MTLEQACVLQRLTWPEVCKDSGTRERERTQHAMHAEYPVATSSPTSFVCPSLLSAQKAVASSQMMAHSQKSSWLASDSSESPPKASKRPRHSTPGSWPESIHCVEGVGDDVCGGESDSSGSLQQPPSEGQTARADEEPLFWARELREYMKAAGAKTQLKDVILMTACSGTGAASLALKACHACIVRAPTCCIPTLYLSKGPRPRA